MLLAAGLGLSTLGAVFWLIWGDWLQTEHPQTPPVATAESIARGEYLARIGHCIACHTRRGGEPLAGGRPIVTPFGPVYSSNLTPDPDTGLGQWTADDFWRALHLGRSRNGRLLAPAFPYEHTSVLTRDDSDALFAWLREQAAHPHRPPPHDLAWPAGTQAALAVWRALFFRPQAFTSDPRQSAEWNRGAYLVKGPGQCAACHGPRNAWGAGQGVDALSGSRMAASHWYAPSLISETETGLASTPIDDIVRLLQTGISATASTSGPMAEVVLHSLQHMTAADLRAMAVYLQWRAREAGPVSVHAPAAASPATDHARGRAVYEAHCADCHGRNGEGRTPAYPALRGNRAVRLADPSNLIQLVLHGGYPPVTRGNPQPYGMPPFLLELDDRDIAATLNYLRTALQAGEAASGDVSPQQVRRVRDAAGR